MARMAVEIAPHFVVNHFTLANVYIAMVSPPPWEWTGIVVMAMNGLVQVWFRSLIPFKYQWL